jgi:hypothetical protein
VPQGISGLNIWVNFKFTDPIPVDPGSTYVVELESQALPTGGTFFWRYNRGDPYPDGRYISKGNPEGDRDFCFRTYGAELPPEMPVGGEVIQPNTIIPIISCLALLSLIITRLFSRKKLLCARAY